LNGDSAVGLSGLPLSFLALFLLCGECDLDLPGVTKGDTGLEFGADKPVRTLNSVCVNVLVIYWSFRIS